MKKEVLAGIFLRLMVSVSFIFLGVLLICPEGVIGEEIRQLISDEERGDPLSLGNIQEQKVGLELLKQDRAECLLKEKLNKEFFDRGIISRQNYIRQSIKISNLIRLIDQMIKEYQSGDQDPAWIEDRREAFREAFVIVNKRKK